MLDVAGAIRYCVKYAHKDHPDRYFWYNIDPFNAIYHKSGRAARAYIAAYEGKENWKNDIYVQFPELLGEKMVQLDRMAEFGRRAREPQRKKAWIIIPRRSHSLRTGEELGPPTDREPKFMKIPVGDGFERRKDGSRVNVYLKGDKKTGKTTLRMWMQAAGFRGFPIPVKDDFSLFQNGYFHFMYLDEFKGHSTMPVQKLNHLMDGSDMPLNGKYMQCIIKQDNPITFIMSNYDAETVYESEEQRKAKKENRLMTEAEAQVSANDEGIAGFLERVGADPNEPGYYIDTDRYNLFKSKFYHYDESKKQPEGESDHLDCVGEEIIISMPDPGKYCIQCGRYLRGQNCKHHRGDLFPIFRRDLP